MNVSELAKALSLEVLTQNDSLTREVTGCYIGDLLSWVMGRAKPGDAWITVMSNVNIVAVASLSDVACIVLAEDVSVDAEVLKKAEAQDIAILRSKLPGFETALQIAQTAGL